MRFDKIVSREFLAVAGSGLACGFLLGVGVSSYVYIDRASELSEGVRRQSARLAVLESLVVESPDFAALDAPRTAKQDPSVVISEASSQVTAIRPRMATPSPSPSQALPKNTSSGPVQPTGEPMQAQRQMPASPIPEPPPGPALPESVAPEEIAAVIATSKLEGVAAEKARVARVTSEGVFLSSGKLVRPGERFASGEKLLQVDPANNRVITSERQILLFFGN